MTDEQRQARAALLKVVRVIPLGGTSARLELENGDILELEDGTRAAVFPVLDSDGLAVLTYEYGRPASDCYAIPAELYPELLTYFPDKAAGGKA